MPIRVILATVSDVTAVTVEPIPAKFLSLNPAMRPKQGVHHVFKANERQKVPPNLLADMG